MGADGVDDALVGWVGWGEWVRMKMGTQVNVYLGRPAALTKSWATFTNHGKKLPILRFLRLRLPTNVDGQKVEKYRVAFDLQGIYTWKTKTMKTQAAP